MDSTTLKAEFEGQLKDAEAKIAQAEEQLTKLKEYKIKLVGGLETLDLLKVYDKDIYIIDTYEGMTEPLDNDYQVINNFKMNKGEMMVTLKKVKENVLKSNYPIEKLHFIKTDVRKKNVLVENIKQDISILRLDTDFYDSTLAILEALYFKVNKNGYLIHDDYGHWKGHYDACKEFYIKNKINPSLIRTCRKERVEIKY